MKLLLDSYTYVWWLIDDPALGKGARAAIVDPASTVHVSAASVWELSIKAALGKINLGGADLVSEIEANGFDALPISCAHAACAGALPKFHDDPFDRMLIAQAQVEGMTCVSRDAAFSSYGISMLW